MDAKVGHGIALAKLGQKDEGIQLLQEVEALNPNIYLAHTALGVLCLPMPASWMRLPANINKPYVWIQIVLKQKREWQRCFYKRRPGLMRHNCLRKFSRRNQIQLMVILVLDWPYLKTEMRLNPKSNFLKAACAWIPKTLLPTPVSALALAAQGNDEAAIKEAREALSL